MQFFKLHLRLGEAMFQKLRGIGARSSKVGNACLYALSTMPGLEPTAQLARLGRRVASHRRRRQIKRR